MCDPSGGALQGARRPAPPCLQAAFTEGGAAANHGAKSVRPALTRSTLTQTLTETLRELAALPPDARHLAQALRLLAKWRAELLANTIVARSGARVQAGPFAGMDYGAGAAEGARSARLLGSYEASLVPVIEEIIALAPGLILDLGAAEGYYAVGLARRLPQARVLAHDADPRAQALCRALAARNGVADRVTVGGRVTPQDLQACLTPGAVVICDIEGEETGLLDPLAAPVLGQVHILVECHDCLTPGIADLLTARFAASHRIRRIDRALDSAALPPWMETLSDLDRLIALWEWRSGPTPWLWMTPA